MATHKTFLIESLDIVSGYGAKDAGKSVTSAVSIDNLRRNILKDESHILVAKKFRENTKVYRVIWVYQILKSTTSVSYPKRLGFIVAGPTSTFVDPQYVWVPVDKDYDEGRMINKDGSLGGHPKDGVLFEVWNNNML